MPKTKVIGFQKTNNFCVQSFSSCYTKMGEKVDFSKRIVHFQMHSSFKFYLSNEVSNEKVPKTKVVDPEILSKFGIQKFFI